MMIARLLSEEMAEFIGILVGDGGINMGKRRGDTIVVHSGKEDYEYLENHVRPLIKELFDIDTKIVDRHRKNEIFIRICSHGLFNILTQKYGLWYGAKSNIGVPDVIKSASDEIQFAFLRGLFDTDFCFRTVKNNYPILQADFKSSALVIQLREILLLAGITSYVKTDIKRSFKNSSWITNRIQISGWKNLDKWVYYIGSNNPKHLAKIHKCMGARGLAAIEKPLFLSNPGPSL